MKVLYVIALVIAGGLSIAAQERVITESEFSEISMKAQTDLYKGVHGPTRRVTEIASNFDGRPDIDSLSRSVFLVVPGQGTHRTEDRTVGGVQSRTETIRLKDSSFIRSTDGVWKEINSRPQSNLSNQEPTERKAVNPQPVDRQVEFKYVGTETYGKREVHVYTKTERKKEPKGDIGASDDSESTTKIRVALNGDYYRFESNTKSKNAHGITINSKMVIEIESDPTLTVAAPIPSKKL